MANGYNDEIAEIPFPPEDAEKSTPDVTTVIAKSVSASATSTEKKGKEGQDGTVQKINSFFSKKLSQTNEHLADLTNFVDRRSVEMTEELTGRIGDVATDVNTVLADIKRTIDVENRIKAANKSKHVGKWVLLSCICLALSIGVAGGVLVQSKLPIIAAAQAPKSTLDQWKDFLWQTHGQDFVKCYQAAGSNKQPVKCTFIARPQ